MRQISSMKAKFFALVCLIILLMIAIGRSLYAASPSPTIVRVGYPQLNGAVIPL